MRKELMMEAIGNISDKHIMEFASPGRFDKRQIKKNVAIAACMCIVVVVSVIVGVNYKGLLSKHQGGGDVIWGIKDLNSYEDTTKESTSMEPGTIKVADSLTEAFLNSTAESDVFAIMVHETSGAEKNDVYQQFVLKQGVKEDYLENGIIFATIKQVESFTCPDNMSIVLYLAKKEANDVIINKDNIEDVDLETLLVTINLKDDIESVLQELDKYEDILSQDEYQKKRLSAIQENVEKVINTILQDYNISEDALLIKGKILPYFRAEVSKETLKNLLEDDRVGTIIMHESGNGEKINDFGKIIY